MIFNLVLGSSLRIWLKGQKREPLRGEFARCWLLGISLCLANMIGFEKAHSADNSIPNLKLYAYQSFKTWDQFNCYNYLVYRESRWNYKAVNGSHYGLGQIKNKMVLKQTPRQQITFHMKYISHRYGQVNGEPNACKAAEHFDAKGWH